MTKDPADLLNNVHDIISSPNESASLSLVHGKYAYYHYGCDSVNDCGWGCGYRTLQTIGSWAYYNTECKISKLAVPSIMEIQTALVDMKDKPETFIKSRDWIGSLEVCYCMDYFYDIPCKVHHLSSADNLVTIVTLLKDHFTKFGSPVMMGGDQDAASKCVLGIAEVKEGSDTYLLILDPHCAKTQPKMETLIIEKWLSWRHINSFDKTSFYNFCLPQAATKNK